MTLQTQDRTGQVWCVEYPASSDCLVVWLVVAPPRWNATSFSHLVLILFDNTNRSTVGSSVPRYENVWGDRGVMSLRTWEESPGMTRIV